MRKLTEREKRSLLFAVFTAVFLTATFADLSSGHCATKSKPTQAVVVAVLDGDTVLLHTGQRLRYLGVDAPEVAHGETPASCFGNEAKAANATWVLHKKIDLKYDGRAFDSHGRLLAYVYLPGGQCVNGELVSHGYATAFKSHDGLGLWDEFVKYQKEAVRGRKGMWGACPAKEELYYLDNRSSYIFHRPGCSWARHHGRHRWSRLQTRWESLELGYSPCRWCKP